ncbi:PREDICTED: methyltransferase-like protein 17, mitochondrial [Galeopterus variegatus]|uniref:Methyltransferase-like protein 17, mitochondrial n=1 Tax=Galeopterus variegatus TaxID=482537 RepID=A0ABM0RP10_GALVR|nr:PREDICTED: methyltransferase-like protein 17, mitochondrial [Galeopterus variegatus]
MATVGGLRYLVLSGRWRRGLRAAPQSRALAALVPGVTQVDNKSGFLEKRPHRQHPGILQLPHVRLPRALADAAQLLLLESAVPSAEKQVQALTNYLWSRHLPVEPEELQRRAVHLEEKFLENSGLLTVLGARAYVEYMYVDSSAAMLNLADKLLKDENKCFSFFSGPCFLSVYLFRLFLWPLTSYALLVAASLLSCTGCSESGEPYVPAVFFRQLLPVSPKVQFDMVVSAFSLSELPSKADRAEVVQTLWHKTLHFLVLVENGTKAGHRLLMDARDLVLKGKEKSPLDSQPGFSLPRKRRQWRKSSLR